MVGIFPVLYFFLHNKKGHRVTTEVPALHAKAPTDVVILRSLVGNDRLQIKITDLLFLRAEGNYVIATYRYEDKTRDFVFRHSLKALQEKNEYAVYYTMSPFVHDQSRLYEHLNGMIFSVGAAYTAFLAFGAQSLLPVISQSDWAFIPWVLPTLLAGISVTLLAKKYRPKRASS